MLAVLTISRKHHQIATGFEAANHSRFIRHSRLSQNPHATAIILTHGEAGIKLFRQQKARPGGGNSNGLMIARAPRDIAMHAVPARDVSVDATSPRAYEEDKCP